MSGHPWVGGTGTLATVASLAGIFVYGRRTAIAAKQANDRGEKQKLPVATDVDLPTRPGGSADQ